jgi:hypothetical protein
MIAPASRARRIKAENVYRLAGDSIFEGLCVNRETVEA